MSNILLHPEKGLNPRMGRCARCSERNGVIVLLGKLDKKGRCSNCNTFTYGVNNRGECPACNKKVKYLDLEEIKEHEDIPTEELCEKCKVELNNLEEEVEQGGIFVRCKQCKSLGVIKRDSPLAIHVRKKSKIIIPNHVGCELDECPNCTKDNN